MLAILPCGCKHEQLWHADPCTAIIITVLPWQVTVYGRGRLGHDIFLGEVVIALRELEEVSSDQPPDIRQYVLGRRSAKEKVRPEGCTIIATLHHGCAVLRL